MKTSQVRNSDKRKFVMCSTSKSYPSSMFLGFLDNIGINAIKHI